MKIKTFNKEEGRTAKVRPCEGNMKDPVVTLIEMTNVIAPLHKKPVHPTESDMGIKSTVAYIRNPHCGNSLAHDG